MKTLPLSFAVLAALSIAPAFAATPINETRPLDPRGSIDVSNLKGRIEVRAWDKPEVRITGSLGDGVERLQIEGDQRSLDVQVRYPRGSNRAEPTTLILDVPRLAELEIDGVAVDIDVQGVAGSSLDIESVSGDIVAVGAPRQADISSVSGNLQLNLNSEKVEVESVSGNIALRGRISNEVSAETVSGDIRIDSRGEPMRKLDTSSVSGNASYVGGLAAGGRISAESVSGSIRLSLPKALSARVHGESFSGGLSAPGAQIDQPRYGPGASFEHTYGNGDGEIRMETFSGSAELVLE
ncbi:DUF4097 family beta strand repeat-containing protein [Luteimonas sp. SDU101]|uniref:DUF4097 family beta strand repeat-containing protein n=1 Tax=Luteimonas sp. SDU101 TaxID=3422593 RepID=UPI003EBFB602